MTHGKVRRCHMAPQKSDTWHKKKWLTLSHMGCINSMAHNEPCVERNPMAHIKLLECMMS